MIICSGGASKDHPCLRAGTNNRSGVVLSAFAMRAKTTIVTFRFPRSTCAYRGQYGYLKFTSAFGAWGTSPGLLLTRPIRE
jgi:hypothetical protein